MKKQADKILVAMSGGVDSSVCALLLKQQGFDVLGVHFIMQKEKDDSKRVKQIAKKIGIDLKIIDVAEDFKAAVIESFVNEYKNNRTPNPCVVCNPKLKFSSLIKVADNEGIYHIATGHYACVKRIGVSAMLCVAKDSAKDQSYFLYRLGQGQLIRTHFPLCDLAKKDVKELAKKYSLPIQEKESQDICFFQKKETLKHFLGRYYQMQEGEILDEQGNKLGNHQGYMLHTIGQRQGLKLGGNGPYFVIEKDHKKNSIVVTSNRRNKLLWTDEIEITQAIWIAKQPKRGKIYEVKTRYQQKATSGKLTKHGRKWIAKLWQPQWAVAPGQSLVVYDGEKVIGGGIIKTTKHK